MHKARPSVSRYISSNMFQLGQGRMWQLARQYSTAAHLETQEMGLVPVARGIQVASRETGDPKLLECCVQVQVMVCARASYAMCMMQAQGRCKAAWASRQERRCGPAQRHYGSLENDGRAVALHNKRRAVHRIGGCWHRNRVHLCCNSVHCTVHPEWLTFRTSH